jgi:hypothetical protein
MAYGVGDGDGAVLMMTLFILLMIVVMNDGMTVLNDK